MRPFLKLSPEVEEALARRRPVVALESTVISHGLPHPANLETALAMEAAVRETGSVPATIAVLKGQVTVGLTREQIVHLATAPRETVRKCSRRDFAIAVARGEDAATTVAGTLMVAHQAGIRVFATGGIGGIHRGQPHDVSADLVELGRSPLAVVCSGAKSILNLPLTLEFLETQGVPVVGLATDQFPGFYVRKTGLPVDASASSIADAARIAAASFRLGLPQAVILAVPVPPADALAPDRLESLIARALADAETQGVRGKSLTPFLLGQIAVLSAGASQRANISLLINNARVAGQLAFCLEQANEAGPS